MSTTGDRRSARKAKARADRALCPVAVSATLGLRVADVAEAMRAHAVARPLDVATAGRRLRGAEPMPDRVCELLTRKAVRAARRCAGNGAGVSRRSMRTCSGPSGCTGSSNPAGADASTSRRRSRCGTSPSARRDLARGATAGDLSDGERAALRVVGVDPGLPRTANAGAAGPGPGPCRPRRAPRRIGGSRSCRGRG